MIRDNISRDRIFIKHTNWRCLWINGITSCPSFIEYFLQFVNVSGIHGPCPNWRKYAISRETIYERRAIDKTIERMDEGDSEIAPRVALIKTMAYCIHCLIDDSRDQISAINIFDKSTKGDNIHNQPRGFTTTMYVHWRESKSRLIRRRKCLLKFALEESRNRIENHITYESFRWPLHHFQRSSTG